MSPHKIDVIASRKFLNYQALCKKEAASWLKLRGKNNYQLEIKIVPKSEIQRYNKKYLKRDYATDILSFPLKKIPGESKVNIGTLLICGDIIEERAKTEAAFKKELVFVLRHGINHLLGIHHHKPQAS